MFMITWTDHGYSSGQYIRWTFTHLLYGPVSYATEKLNAMCCTLQRSTMRCSMTMDLPIHQTHHCPSLGPVQVKLMSRSMPTAGSLAGTLLRISTGYWSTPWTTSVPTERDCTSIHSYWTFSVTGTWCHSRQYARK